MAQVFNSTTPTEPTTSTVLQPSMAAMRELTFLMVREARSRSLQEPPSRTLQAHALLTTEALRRSPIAATSRRAPIQAPDCSLILLTRQAEPSLFKPGL